MRREKQSCYAIMSPVASEKNIGKVTVRLLYVESSIDTSGASSLAPASMSEAITCRTSSAASAARTGDIYASLPR
jgi:hypothetical protein